MPDGRPPVAPHPTLIIGRAEQIASARQTLLRRTVRLVTLIGPPGVGKTRLAYAVVESLSPEFRDGAVLIDLSPVADAARVPYAVAQGLGLHSTANRSILDVLKDHLAARHLLLVLDNFEHLLPARSQVADVLAACPELKILVTSRVALNLRSEYRLPVQPLAFPDPAQPWPAKSLAQYPAIELFVERARAVDPWFSLEGDNAHAVAAICARLDGLPPHSSWRRRESASCQPRPCWNSSATASTCSHPP